MRVPHVTIDMLVAVIALAQKKNLEPAGKELGLSPSAVYKRIKAANQIFGTRLFVGTNDGFELTEVGRVLYSHARLPLEQVLLAEETTIAASELHASHLLVGHSTYLPSRLLALIHSLPFTSALGIRLEHKPGLTLALAQDVVKGTLHAGLGYLPVSHPDLLVYQVTEEPIMVCMPNGHPLTVKPAIRPKDLEGQPIIAASRDTFPILHRQIEEFFEDFGIKLNIVADAYGPHEAITMVEQKVGICMVAVSNAKPSVISRPLLPQTLTRKCGLFVREDNRHPALKSFINLLLERTAPWHPSR
jgi:LysR family transcriptional regulator, benzoate and cis,cis-muconate-responsive activator of ben and cat genes